MGGLVRIRVRYGHYADAWFDYLLMSKKELEDLCRGTGWKVRRYFDNKWGPGYVAVLGKSSDCRSSGCPDQRCRGTALRSGEL
jgi:hypothetical protein